MLIWLAVIAQCFVFSMFTVFGKRGGLIGFAALLLMTLTMHSPLEPDQVLAHAAATLGGALFYVAFSLGFSRLFWLREEQQAMSVALFATADCGRARRLLRRDRGPGRRLSRADPEPVHHDGKHQAARDMVLRALPRGKGLGDRQRVMIWNMFVDMLQLLDTLVATHTDTPRARWPATTADLHARRAGEDVAGTKPHRAGRVARSQGAVPQQRRPSCAPSSTRSSSSSNRASANASRKCWR